MTDQKLLEHWIQGSAVQRIMFRDGLVLNLEDYNELVISTPITLTLPATASSPVEVVSIDPAVCLPYGKVRVVRHDVPNDGEG